VTISGPWEIFASAFRRKIFKRHTVYESVLPRAGNCHLLLKSLVETLMRCLAVLALRNPPPHCDDHQTSHRRFYQCMLLTQNFRAPDLKKKISPCFSTVTGIKFTQHNTGRWQVSVGCYGWPTSRKRSTSGGFPPDALGHPVCLRRSPTCDLRHLCAHLPSAKIHARRRHEVYSKLQGFISWWVIPWPCRFQPNRHWKNRKMWVPEYNSRDAWDL